MNEVAEKTKDRLIGLVEIVTFHNEENGFCILKTRVKGEKELVPVLGHSPVVNPGEYLTAEGEWVVDRNHGRQFKAETLVTESPNTVEGIKRYLGSGLVKGIGETYAGRLVDTFGLKVFAVIEDDPARLLTVNGIGKKRADKITGSWAEQKYVREIMVYLHANGVTTNKAVRIYKRYGKDAVAKIEHDPYCLARDIRGIGFLSADTIAQKMGVPLDSPVRARAGVSHVLAEAAKDGHCGLPYSKLVDKAVELLAIPQQTITAALDHEMELGAQLRESGGKDDPLGQGLIETTVAGIRCVFLPSLYQAEQAAANHIKRLLKGPLPWPAFDVEAALPWVEGKLGIELADAQREAVRLGSKSKVLVITGGPGTGKTTLVRSLLTVLQAKKVRVLLAAPTGKAAKRLAESTGREAKTIHRLLEVDGATGGFKRNRKNPLDCDLLVVDEASMIDVVLGQKLLDAIGTGTALIIVGDVDQLPSVGPGQFLTDVIDSKVVPVVSLTEIRRQAAGSRIICAAHEINHGKLPALPAKGEKSDFHFIAVEEAEDIAKMVVDLVRSFVPKHFGLDPLRDVQVLCPMKSGVTGSRGLNVALQEVLNPPSENSVERFGFKYSVGDKVMQIENNYDADVFNGDVGFITKIDKNKDVEELTVDFDGREVVYPFSDLDELVLCFAFSIHKSQGSEYPCVIIPCSTQHYTMLQRNLIYTGVTRGKSLVIVVGTLKALGIAVRNKQTRRRVSKLAEWLSGKSSVAPPAPAPVAAPAHDPWVLV